MAAMPLIRTGVKIVGRDRIKNFVAGQLATLIQGYVGAQAARALAPHVADAGLRLLSLEAAPEQLGAEALVDTLQEAVADVMSLPAEALEDPLRLEAEIGDALGAAAVRHLPPAVLRDDLPGHDPDGPGWVLLPRTGQRAPVPPQRPPLRRLPDQGPRRRDRAARRRDPGGAAPRRRRRRAGR